MNYAEFSLKVIKVCGGILGEVVRGGPAAAVAELLVRCSFMGKEPAGLVLHRVGPAVSFLVWDFVIDSG